MNLRLYILMGRLDELILVDNQLIRDLGEDILEQALPGKLPHPSIASEIDGDPKVNLAQGVVHHPTEHLWEPIRHSSEGSYDRYRIERVVEVG